MRALVFIAACTVPVTAPIVVDPTPTVPAFVVPDETMSYAVSLGGAAIAEITTTVGEPGALAGKRAVMIKTNVKVVGVLAAFAEVRTEIDTTVDLDTGTPIRSHEEAWAEFDGEREHEARDLSGGYDFHTAITTLRGWHAKPNEHRKLHIAMGEKAFDVEVWPVGTIQIKNRPAVKYDGLAGDHPFSIWVSDDAARVPLRAETDTEIGKVRITLVGYE